MFETCLKKQQEIKLIFAECKTEEAKYAKIIELGRQQPRLAAAYKTEQNLVKGCQSATYLRAYLENNLVVFEADSDALISFGLAALLLRVYNHESPEAILKCPPDYLEEIGIKAGLTPSRANGLYSMHLRMKQEALKLLIAKDKQP